MRRQNAIWHKCHPDRPGIYIVQTEDGHVTRMKWHGGWNCELDMQTGEIYRRNERFDVLTWREV